MATFPAGITTLGHVGALESVAPLHDTHHNTLIDELVAVQTTLAANPQGGFASVAARIAAREPTITTYTPTLGGTGWVLGSTGTATGRYVSVDGLCVFSAILTFGGTGMTFGAVLPTVTLPVNAQSSQSLLRRLTVVFVDVSAGNPFYGVGQITAGLNAASCYVQQVSGTAITDGSPTSTSPFTWTTGDQIYLSGTYITL